MENGYKRFRLKAELQKIQEEYQISKVSTEYKNMWIIFVVFVL